VPVHNSPSAWGAAAKAFHWSIAALVLLAVVPLGWAAELLQSPAWRPALAFHAGFGLLVFLLMLLRFGWRLADPRPAPPVDEPAWSRRAARTVHSALYLALLTMPVTGYVVLAHMLVHMDEPIRLFGVVSVPLLFDPPREDERLRAAAWLAHFWTFWALTLLLAVHVAAALWWHFARRDDTLRRMLPGRPGARDRTRMDSGGRGF
jgi:cytochrome b561